MVILLLDLGTGTTPEVCLLCKSSLSHTIWSRVFSDACVSFNKMFTRIKKATKGTLSLTFGSPLVKSSTGAKTEGNSLLSCSGTDPVKAATQDGHCSKVASACVASQTVASFRATHSTSCAGAVTRCGQARIKLRVHSTDSSTRAETNVKCHYHSRPLCKLTPREVGGHARVRPFLSFLPMQVESPH